MRVSQARDDGADDRTRGPLLLAPVTKVRGEILEVASSFPESAAFGPQNEGSESDMCKVHVPASGMKGECLVMYSDQGAQHVCKFFYVTSQRNER